MINARQEFVEHVDEYAKSPVLCAIITRGYFCEDGPREYKLKLGYSESDLQEFLGLLNFKYDSGFGSQELHGTIWYSDGTYSQRGEYDGSEWWECCALPEIPEELK